MSIEDKWTGQFLKVGTYEEEIVRGHIRGAYPLSVYGRVMTAGAVQNTLVRTIDGSGAVIPVPVAAGEQMSVVSTHIADADAGTGVNSLIIEYLDHNLDSAYELVVLDGTTPVNTIATDIRWIQKIYAASLGTGGLAAGEITITGVTSAVDYENMWAGQRSGDTSFFRVPRAKRLILKSVYVGASSGTADSKVRVELCSTMIGAVDQQESGLLYSHAGLTLQDGSTTMPLLVGFPASAGTIVGFIASSSKAASITAGFGGWVEDI